MKEWLPGEKRQRKEEKLEMKEGESETEAKFRLRKQRIWKENQEMKIEEWRTESWNCNRWDRSTEKWKFGKSIDEYFDLPTSDLV